MCGKPDFYAQNFRNATEPGQPYRRWQFHFKRKKKDLARVNADASTLSRQQNYVDNLHFLAFIRGATGGRPRVVNTFNFV